MPYANIEDRRARCRARYHERRAEYREYARQRNIVRSSDPAYIEARAATALRRRIARREFISALKLERGCADCGYCDHPAALDFDHVRGTKAFAIAEIGANRSVATLMREIDKCDVVCANCHRVRHHGLS